MGLSTTTLEPSLVTEGRRKAGAATVPSPPSGGSTPSRRPPPPRSLQLLGWGAPRLLRDLVDRVLRALEVAAVDLAVQLDRIDLPAERDQPLDVRIAALARRWKETGLAEVVGPPAVQDAERQRPRYHCHDDVQDGHGLGAAGRCEEKTLARPFASTASTSKGSGSGPSIPGDPIGIPGSARPAIRGRFSRSRFTSSAGT